MESASPTLEFRKHRCVRGLLRAAEHGNRAGSCDWSSGGLSSAARGIRAKLTAPLERAEAAKRDFELTFFNLLSLLRETVKEVDVPDPYGLKPVHGRDAFKRLLEEYIGGTRGSDDQDGSVFRGIYFRFRDDLAHYFRLVYHILKYIKQTEDIDKMLYVRLLRATLSNAEIVLIALNCMYGGGRQKLKPLVEEFALLHNISSADVRTRRIVSAFDPTAFGNRTFTESDDGFAD